jgi:hypothetical protein
MLRKQNPQKERPEEERLIDERLSDEGERSPEAMEFAAEEGFVQDQREDPGHPSRRHRELDRRHGIENPSHSRGI